MFRKLQQGSGGTNFINVQQVIEKVKIQRAKLVCRKSICNVLMLISKSFNFNIERKHAISLSYIFLKNYVKLYAPRSSKEP